MLPAVAEARAVLGALLDLVWPLSCPVCRAELTGGDVERDGPLGPPTFHVGCLDRLTTTALGALSPDVTWMPARWLYMDDPTFFRVLHAAKFDGRPTLVQPLAERLGVAAVRRGWVPTGAVVVPVPDDPSRARPRGDGVVTRIAATLAAAAAAKLRLDLVHRRSGGPPLSTVGGAAARRRAVAGRYRVSRLAEVPRDAPLVLVDDQLTTGATATELGRLLAGRGNPVCLVTLAGSAAAPTELPLTLRNADL